MHGRGECAWKGACVAGVCMVGGGACVVGETAPETGGKHPTEIHSCLTSERWNTVGINYFTERLPVIINIQINKLGKNHKI